MKITYNVSNKTALAEPSPIGNIVPNAKRNQNFAPFCGRTQPNPLWRNLSYSSVLQKVENKMAFAEKGSFPSAFQSLSSSRINPGYHLCFDCWYPPSEQNKDSSRQWCFSTDCRLKELSLLQQFKTFFKKSQPQNNSRYQQGSRSLKVKDVLFASASNQPPLRFRFLRSYPLRQVYRRSQGRLQPSQKRCSFLSSFALLRISLQRFLAWYLKARRYLYLHWFSRILKNMLKQTSSLCLSYSSPGRLWFLRPQVYRASGRGKNWLLYCSQDDSSYQEQSRKSSLSPVQEELGSCRVSLSTISLEETTPFCSNQTTPTRKRLRTTYSLYFKALCLSDLCNQSLFKSRKGLVFLSSTSSHRDYHQGTERKFCPGEDPNQQLPGQPGLFFFAPFCLQYSQLVQEALSTSKISERYFRDYSDRVFGSSCKVSQIATQKHTQITSRIYLRTNTKSYYSKN